MIFQALKQSSSLVLCLFRQIRDSNGTILLCSSPSLSLLYRRDFCSSSSPTSLFSVFLEPSSPSFGPPKLSSAVSLCVIHAQSSSFVFSLLCSPAYVLHPLPLVLPHLLWALSSWFIGVFSRSTFQMPLACLRLPLSLSMSLSRTTLRSIWVLSRSFLQIKFQFPSQQFTSFSEFLFSHCNPSLYFRVASAVLRYHAAQIADICSPPLSRCPDSRTDWLVPVWFHLLL